MLSSDNIRPACLPKPGQTADVGMVVTPIGWGRPSDCKLKEISLPIFVTKFMQHKVALVMCWEWLRIYQ